MLPLFSYVYFHPDFYRTLAADIIYMKRSDFFTKIIWCPRFFPRQKSPAVLLWTILTRSAWLNDAKCSPFIYSLFGWQILDDCPSCLSPAVCSPRVTAKNVLSAHASGRVPEVIFLVNIYLLKQNNETFGLSVTLLRENGTHFSFFSVFFFLRPAGLKGFYVITRFAPVTPCRPGNVAWF